MMELLDKQKRAMEKSIEHWEEVVADPTLPATADECECCRVFGCDLVSACVECRCPVAQYTKQDQCNGTPYYDHRSKKTKATALAMLNFLKVVYADLCRGKLKAAPKAVRKPKPPAPKFKRGDRVKLFVTGHTGTVVRENDPKEDVKLYCDDCDACFTMRASVLALLNSKVEG